MDKQDFFLFRRKRRDGKGYEYIQYLTSASHDEGLTCSCQPDFAWRGRSKLDIEKMRYLISISKNYKNSNWELVRYNMEVEQPSWALIPKEPKQYESLPILKFCRLTDKEEQELEDFKQKMAKKWKKEDTLTKETPMK